MSNRSIATLALAGLMGWGCARPADHTVPAPAQTALAGADAGADPVLARDTTAPRAVDDSTADQMVLDALEDLEFGSLDRRAGRVRGQVDPGAAPSPTDLATESVLLFGDPAGGPASAGGVSRRLDTESFANHARVQYYIDFFLGEARDRFTIWLGRLARYEGMIRTELERNGVPEDFVFLAMIESGYSNTAVSRARAVGMWQFIASTGRRYGLEQDVWVDERRDPFLATRAAARHLADLNETFGSWYLAAAAYNGGAGRVSRGLERLPEGPDGASDSAFFALSDRRYLRRETRDYVPKLIAAALISRDPGRFGFDSIPVLPPLAFDEVRISDATGLDVLARLADTTTRALIELNPQFVRQATPPARTVTVRVPAGTGPTVARRWDSLPANERITFVTHRVARGETLSQIAQRYRISTRVLQAANPGVEPRRLRIGQRLTVPVSPAAQARVGSAPRSAPARASAPATGGSAYHTVRSGDSLWTIARRYNVRVADLQSWNGMDGTVLQPGQRLRVQAP